MTKIKHLSVSIDSVKTSADAVFVFGFFQNDSLSKHSFAKMLQESDRAYLSVIQKGVKKDFVGCERVIFPSGKRSGILVGLGLKERWNRRSLEKVARSLVQYAKKYQYGALAVHLDDFKIPGLSIEQVAELFACNIELGDYEFNTYKEVPNDGWPALWSVSYISSRRDKLSKALSAGALIGMEANAVRELANTPGGIMTPKRLANAARAAGDAAGFSVKTLSEKDMKKLGMGGILGVSSGSTEEAQLIVMEYYGKKSKKDPIVFIGKGITFDSGGLQIKPSSSMEEMHMDMSGGASIIGSLTVIAKLKLSVNCIGIVPAVENMPSGGSYRPGDILKTMSGKSVEVGHTDAEGRVVLTDALTYAERYKPKLVIDVATLTGACVVALGHYCSALLTPQDNVADFLMKCGDNSGDYLWRLPLWEEYESHIKGYTGDVVNTGRYREAGTIQGAAFLYQFAKKFPAWAHIDIASTMTGRDDQNLSRGASGVGTRLLVEVARGISAFH